MKKKFKKEKIIEPNFDIYDDYDVEHVPRYGKSMFPSIGKMTWELWSRTLSMVEIKELMKEMALYIKSDELCQERYAIIKKYNYNETWSKEDKERYDYLTEIVMELPNGHDKEDREAMKIIREAAKWIKKKDKPEIGEE